MAGFEKLIRYTINFYLYSRLDNVGQSVYPLFFILFI